MSHPSSLAARVAAVAFIACLVPVAAGAAVDRAFLQEHALEPIPGSFLVQATTPQSVEAVGTVARAAGGFVAFEYAIVPGLVNVRGISDATAEALSTVAGVTRVLPDYVVDAGHAESMPIVGALVSQKQAAGVGDFDGAGVRVCVVDTGIRSTHVLFENRVDVAAGRDLVNGDLDPADDNGHGTHVGGTAAGGDGFLLSGAPFQGLAHEATLVAVKVLNASGQGSASWIIGGIGHCTDQGPNGGRADVINLSLGGGIFIGACDGDPMAQAANNAVASGVVVVAAAGNDCSPNAMGSPACGSSVIAVGATWDSSGSRSPRFGCLRGNCVDRDYNADDIACFSNRGSELDVVAPGAAVTSAAHGSDSGVVTYYGTSQATPHVAGLAALLLDQDPSRTPATVRQIIRSTARDLGAAGWDSTFGAGRMDVIAALSGTGGCGDGTCATNENPCGCPQDCGAPPAIETACANGLDDDCDGFTDCDDPDCSSSPNCVSPCGNGVCEIGESPCNCPQDCGFPATTETSCTNGIDDDCDGSIDGADPDCSGGVICGDGVCEGGSENCETCPQDCRNARRGRDCCGDGVCSGSENSRNCPIDCAG